MTPAPQGIRMGCGSLRPAPWWSFTIPITSRTCASAVSWSRTPGISTCSSICSLSSPASSSPGNISAASTMPHRSAASSGAASPASIRCISPRLPFIWRLPARFISALARTDNPARYPLSDLPAQFLLLHAFVGERLTFNFPSWSLSAEMFCYLLFPVVALIAQRRKEAIICARGLHRARQLAFGHGQRNDAVGRLDQPGRRLPGAARLQPRRGLLSVSRPDRPLARDSRRAGRIAGGVYRASAPCCRR